MRRLLGAVAVVLAVLAVVLVVRALSMGGARPPDAAPPTPAPVDAEGALARLQGGLRIRTISHDDAAARDTGAFAALHAHLAASYPRVHASLVRERVGGHSLLYRWAGRDPAAPALVLLAHQDVVGVDPGTASDWTHPPFAAAVSDGYVWGRGTLDDKGSLFAILEAVEALLAEGFVPRADVYLAFGHDEEIGGDEGAQAMAARLAERGVDVGLVLDEGGALIDGRVVGLDRPVGLIGVAEKGYLSVALEVSGAGGHSSAPPRPTHIGRLAAAVARVEQSPLPSRLDPAVRAFFEQGVGPESPFALRLVYANLWLFDPLVRAALERVPGGGGLVRTTTAPTIFQAGAKENVLPARARAVVNFRVMPGETTEEVLEHVRSVVDDPEVRILALPKRREPSARSRTGGPAWETVSTTVREVFPEAVVAPYLMVAGTDSRHYRGLCDCVYQFLPFRLHPDDMRRAHGTDERIPVDGLADAVRFYRRLVANGVSPVAGAADQRRK